MCVCVYAKGSPRNWVEEDAGREWKRVMVSTSHTPNLTDRAPTPLSLGDVRKGGCGALEMALIRTFQSFQVDEQPVSLWFNYNRGT